jgi:hypothetical protein
VEGSGGAALHRNAAERGERRRERFGIERPGTEETEIIRDPMTELEGEAGAPRQQPA